MHLLLAADSADYARLVSLFLRYMGHEVTCVADGEAALEALKRPDGPTLALLHWALPQLSGPEICRRLRAADGPPRFLVLMTGNDSPELERKVRAAGADAFLLRPMTCNQIHALVRQAELAVSLRTPAAADAAD